MGKKRFAVTGTGDAMTSVSRYGRVVSSHVRGWNIGIEINTFVDSEDRDCFEIYVTGGSNDHGIKSRIGTLIEGVGFEEAVHA